MLSNLSKGVYMVKGVASPLIPCLRLGSRKDALALPGRAGAAAAAVGLVCWGLSMVIISTSTRCTPM
jgi:hypothetical protein